MTIDEYKASVPKKRQHHESNLHEDFCLWVKRNFPNDHFVRHEREGLRKGIMLRIHHNTHTDIDKLPDFEGLITNDQHSGFYIEFKKPGRPYCTKDKKHVYSDCVGQYKTHQHLKSLGRAVWFSNNLEHAKSLYIAFKENNTLPMQDYVFHEDKSTLSANKFFEDRGL